MLAREDLGHLFFIKSYDNEGFVISQADQKDSRIHGPIILTPEKKPEPWSCLNADILSEQHIDELITFTGEKPEVIILGLGNPGVIPPGNILAYCYQQKIGVECMDTPSACRTYTILATDGVTMVAGLLPAGENTGS